MKFEDVEVPFIMERNCRVLTGEQFIRYPWLSDFIQQFKNCFDYSINRDTFIFYPEGNAPVRNPLTGRLT